MVLITVMGFGFKASLAYGLILIVSGSLLAFKWTDIFHSYFSSQMELRDGTIRFDHWKETPVPIYFDIYFHNWTNPKNIKSQQPHFTQMGPYRFIEKRTKVNIVWNDNKTVSYRQIRHYVFDPENSVGSLQDRVTTVNPVALAVAYKTRFYRYIDQKVISIGLVSLRQKIEVTKTVDELLFKGYRDDLLTFTNNLPDMLKQGAKTMDRFGWLYQRNGSDLGDGVFNIATGESDLNRIGDINWWNYANETNFFGGSCSKVRGKSGELWSPNIQPSDTLTFFSPDMCRSVDFKYEREESVEGIFGYRFNAGSSIYDSDGQQECYATGECASPKGLLNLTSCRWGVPLFQSYPHFLHGDPSLRQNVLGMQPDIQSHGFHFTVEPTYGIVMQLKAGIQLNLMLEPLEPYRMYSDIPKRLYMPIFWIEQNIEISYWHGWEIWLLLWTPPIGVVLAITMAATGAYLTLLQLHSISSSLRPQPC